MAVSIDPAIRIKPSKDCVTYLQDLLQDEVMDAPKAIQKVTVKSELEISDVQWIFQHLKETGSAETPFHLLLQGSEILLPSPKYPERSPELEARVQRLKLEQENREYRKMTVGIDSPGMSKQNAEESFSQQFKELNNYVLLIVQFVVSVVTSFFFGYLAPYYILGKADIGFRLICGVLVAFVVAVADLYFIMRHFLQAEGVINLEALKQKYI